MRHKGRHVGKVALYGGLVQLVEASSVQLLPQVEALSLLCLLPKPFMLTAHLQEVLVVRVVMGLSFTVGSLLLVDAGKAVSLLSPELEVHAALQIDPGCGTPLGAGPRGRLDGAAGLFPPEGSPP